MPFKYVVLFDKSAVKNGLERRVEPGCQEFGRIELRKSNESLVGLGITLCTSQRNACATRTSACARRTPIMGETPSNVRSVAVLVGSFVQTAGNASCSIPVSRSRRGQMADCYLQVQIRQKYCTADLVGSFSSKVLLESRSCDRLACRCPKQRNMHNYHRMRSM